MFRSWFKMANRMTLDLQFRHRQKLAPLPTLRMRRARGASNISKISTVSHSVMKVVGFGSAAKHLTALLRPDSIGMMINGG